MTSANYAAPPTPDPSPQGGGRRCGTASPHTSSLPLAGRDGVGVRRKLCAGIRHLRLHLEKHSAGECRPGPASIALRAFGTREAPPDLRQEHASPSRATGITLCSGYPLPPTWWRGPGTHSRLRNNKRRSRVPGAGASGRGVLASTTDDRLSGLASDPLRPEGRTIPPLPAVPSVRIVRRDDRAMRKGWDEYEGDGGGGDNFSHNLMVGCDPRT